MSNIIPINELSIMATAVIKSGLFGLKNEGQALTLMLIAQAENIAPIQAIQMYSIINGMPSLKSTEVQSRFQRAGGKIQWIETTNIKASVKLTIDGNEYVSDFTMEDAKRMKLHDKDNYVRMPKQMLMASQDAHAAQAARIEYAEGLLQGRPAGHHRQLGGTHQLFDYLMRIGHPNKAILHNQLISLILTFLL